MSDVVLKEFNNLMDGMQEVLNKGTQNLIDLKKTVYGMQGDLNFLKVENDEIKLKQRELFKRLETTESNSIKALEKITIRNENEFGNDWLGQKDLGLLYEPVISSHQMGHILRKIGMAMKNKTITTPLQKTINAGFVKRGYASNFTAWYWYADKVKNDFEKYLKKNGLYDKFLGINTEKEMEDFINNIK